MFLPKAVYTHAGGKRIVPKINCKGKTAAFPAPTSVFRHQTPPFWPHLHHKPAGVKSDKKKKHKNNLPCNTTKFLVKFAQFLLAKFYKRLTDYNIVSLKQNKHFEENTVQSTARESIFSLGRVILSLEVYFVV